MKKLALLGAVAGLAILASGAGYAADLGTRPAYKAAPPPVAAPVPWSWSGFYIGAHIGDGWGTKEIFDSGFIDPVFAGKAISNASVTGFLGGFQAGYNYQISWVVVGIDAISASPT